MTETNTSLLIHGSDVPVTGSDVGQVLRSHKFLSWVNGLDPRFRVKMIHSQSVDLKGPALRNSTDRFIKFKARVFDEDDKISNPVVFMRGGSVVILVVLECEEEEYTVLTVQPRFAVGIYEFPEIPAGTLERDDFLMEALRELSEETGLIFDISEVKDLFKLVYGEDGEKKFKGIYASPGACDEFYKIVCVKKQVLRSELDELRGKHTGLEEEGEKIVLRVPKLSELPFITPDAKSLSALMLYETAKKMGKI